MRILRCTVTMRFYIFSKILNKYVFWAEYPYEEGLKKVEKVKKSPIHWYWERKESWR